MLACNQIIKQYGKIFETASISLIRKLPKLVGKLVNLVDGQAKKPLKPGAGLDPEQCVSMLMMKTGDEWPKWHQLIVANVLNHLVVKGSVHVVKEGRGFEVSYDEMISTTELETNDMVSD